MKAALTLALALPLLVAVSLNTACYVRTRTQSQGDAQGTEEAPPAQEVQAAEEPAAPARPPAAEVFTGLEDRLATASSVFVIFHVRSEGAVECDLSGELTVDGEESARLSAQGTFDGRPFDHSISLSGRRVTIRTPRGPTRRQAPRHLREALLVGLTRMGILHNLALLADRGLPDHASGGAREWVLASEHAYGDDDAIELAITVDGRPSGTARLHLDAEGSPIRREQVVLFDEGEMRVVEEYGRFEVATEAGP